MSDRKIERISRLVETPIDPRLTNFETEIYKDGPGTIHMKSGNSFHANMICDRIGLVWFACGEPKRIRDWRINHPGAYLRYRLPIAKVLRSRTDPNPSINCISVGNGIRNVTLVFDEAIPPTTQRAHERRTGSPRMPRYGPGQEVAPPSVPKANMKEAAELLWAVLNIEMLIQTGRRDDYDLKDVRFFGAKSEGAHIQVGGSLLESDLDRGNLERMAQCKIERVTYWYWKKWYYEVDLPYGKVMTASGKNVARIDYD